jgi:hypothetical protein
MFFEACQRAVVVLAAFWCAFLVFAIALAVLPLESLQADPALRSLITASMMGVRAHMLSAGRLAGQEYFQLPDCGGERQPVLLHVPEGDGHLRDPAALNRR